MVGPVKTTMRGEFQDGPTIRIQFEDGYSTQRVLTIPEINVTIVLRGRVNQVPPR